MEQTIRNIQHHLNNGLMVAIGHLQLGLKDMPNNNNRGCFEVALKELEEMSYYLETLDRKVGGK